MKRVEFESGSETVVTGSVPAADTVPPREGGVFQTRAKGLASGVRQIPGTAMWQGSVGGVQRRWAPNGRDLYCGGDTPDPAYDLVLDVSPVPAAEPEFVLEGYVVTNSSGATWSGV